MSLPMPKPMPKPLRKPVPVSGLLVQLDKMRKSAGISRKHLAHEVGKTRENVDAAFRGRSNPLLADVEVWADAVGAKLEVVVHRDPVDEFRRALAANKDLSEEWRETIWGTFEKAKAHAMRGAPQRGKPPAASSLRSSTARRAAG